MSDFRHTYWFLADYIVTATKTMYYLLKEKLEVEQQKFEDKAIAIGEKTIILILQIKSMLKQSTQINSLCSYIVKRII